MKKSILVLLSILFLSIPVIAQTVYVTKSGDKYHSSGCSYLKSSRAITLGDAQSSGYTACSRCHPGGGQAARSQQQGIYKAPAKSRSSGGSVQCSGTTQKGARCKRMTTNGDGRCYQH